MPPNYGEANLVLRQKLIEQFPQRFVFDRLPCFAVTSSPMIGFPTSQPFAATLGNVNAVGDNFNFRSGVQSLNPVDDRLQFHLIIGRERFASGKLFLGPGGQMFENAGPSTGTRISTASPIGEDLHVRQLRLRCRSRALGHRHFFKSGQTRTTTTIATECPSF